VSPVVLCRDELYANSTARPRLHLRSSASMRTPPLDGSGEGVSPRPSTAEPETRAPKVPEAIPPTPTRDRRPSLRRPADRSVVVVRTGCRPQDDEDGSGEGSFPRPSTPEPDCARPPETGVRES
jgi:hypothetical protein